MERQELRFATRAALARAFGELVRSPFVEGCQADVERRLLRFTARPGSASHLPPAARPPRLAGPPSKRRPAARAVSRRRT